MGKRRKDGSLKMVSRKNNKQKKIKKAAALRYLPHNDNAPKVTAVGKGRIAEKILEAAEKNKIPVYEDANLANVLNNFNPGDEITPELYGIVAEILIFVRNIDKRYGEEKDLIEHE
jgi:flagellar biosynthesis protein